MKSSIVAIMAVFALTAPVSGAGPSNPVVRVVQLLKGLSEKIEAEGKTEEGLFEDFICWGKSVIAGKTASNSAAKTRIEELETVIADLDSGKTELTSERTDLEKEIQTLNEEQESATAQRTKEEADFEKAEEEMTLAIAALTKAIDVLGNATEDHKTGTFLSVRTQVQKGMSAGGLAALTKQSAILNKAVELSDRILQKGDASFLRRLLTGDVPVVDWKKLNRKATFKMSYKARSFKIQAVLADTLKTFEENLAAARKKEGDAIAAYNALIGDKSGQLSTAESAYSEMATEKGAKALSRSEASDEVDALKAQIEADLGFISQTQTDMATKTSEWKARKELRAGELAAISQTISILYNDDSKDLFKKSFASQGYMLIQKSVAAHTSQKRGLSRAASLLRHMASVTQDKRLLVLAPFSENETVVIQPAIDAIDLLITKLNADEADDLAKKEQCETDRASDTRSAILSSRTIDDKTDLINELTEEIEELTATIEATDTHMKATQAALDEATANRASENKEFLADKKDDEDAAATVLSAKAALSEFYTSKGLMLVQQPVETVAGAAPTPPPKTWEGSYMGATEESTGIIALLEMVHEDIEKDMAKASAEEAASLSAYEDFKGKSDASIAADVATISELTGTKASKESAKSTAISERSSEKGTLNTVLDAIKTKAAAGCDYFAVNYALRRSNRAIELDGLTKAKAYLQGGEFSKIDPDREMKPGDAALLTKQRALRH